MKKKKLKLNLKKDVISKLQAQSIVGGYDTDRLCGSNYCLSDLCHSQNCPTGDCNSDNGCTGTPDETMTCANYSCAC